MAFAFRGWPKPPTKLWQASGSVSKLQSFSVIADFWSCGPPLAPHRVVANWRVRVVFTCPAKPTVRLAGNFTRLYPASDLSANDARRTRTRHAADAERDTRGSGCGPLP